MADVKITGLTADASPTGTDLVESVKDPGGTPLSRKVTHAALVAAAINKTGADAGIVSGTAGTDGDLAVWNTDGDLVDGPTPPAGTIVGHTDTQTLSNKTLATPAVTGDVVFTERADHASTPGAGFGYLWTKNTAPSTLVFTDDAGTDTTLGAAGSGGDPYAIVTSTTESSPVTDTGLVGNTVRLITAQAENLQINLPTGTFVQNVEQYVVYRIKASGAARTISLGSGLTLGTGLAVNLVIADGDTLTLPFRTTAWSDATTVSAMEYDGDWDISQLEAATIDPAADTIMFLDATDNKLKKGLLSALDSRGQKTLWIPAGSMLSRTTSGAAAGTAETTTNDVMLDYLAFDTAADEFAQFAIQMPKSWNEGTLVAQFIWSHPSTTTDFGVAWFLQAGAFADGDAADTAFGTAVGVTDTGGTTDDIYITAETAAITVAGTPGAEEYVIFQVYRDVSDAADDMAVDARLHGIKVHYTTDAASDS